MPYIVSVDQGTSSTRCLLFNERAELISSHQLEHTQSYPQAGWVEHDPEEIYSNVQTCLNKCLEAVATDGEDNRIVAIGITNQRETCLFWSKTTGGAYAPAIVWNDTRTSDICSTLIEEFKECGGKDAFQSRTGLPISTYFSMSKILYLFESVEGLLADAVNGEALFGTIDTYIIWRLTNGTVHATDVTNASRTMLMNIETLQWDISVLNDLDIPSQCLPTIYPSSHIFGYVDAANNDLDNRLNGVPIGGVLGDQQAALFGQVCFNAGDAKCTYGTGAFLLMNTGKNLIYSSHGLLTTVGYQLSVDAPPIYALEGSIAYSGSVIQWLRDNVNFISQLSDCEELARSVDDSQGLVFVPAFAGLFAPYWRSDARGLVIGLTAYHTKAHITRAALEATAFQVADVLKAMEQDSQIILSNLKVDGGQTKNELLMQFQSDLLDVSLTRPVIAETTALGACFAAGLAVGLWENIEELKALYRPSSQWHPNMFHRDRYVKKTLWKNAVSRSLEWHRDNQDDEEEEAEDFYSGNTSPAKRLAMTPNKTSYEETLPMESSDSFKGNDSSSQGVHWTVSSLLGLAIGLVAGMTLQRRWN